MKKIEVLDEERLMQFLYFSKETTDCCPSLTEEDYAELKDACKGSVLCSNDFI